MIYTHETTFVAYNQRLVQCELITLLPSKVFGLSYFTKIPLSLAYS